jgi:hypothetical protein
MQGNAGEREGNELEWMGQTGNEGELREMHLNEGE